MLVMANWSTFRQLRFLSQLCYAADIFISLIFKWHAFKPATYMYISTLITINIWTFFCKPSDSSDRRLSVISVAWSDKEFFYYLLDGMLVHHRVTPNIKFAGIHLYTLVERGTVRVKCLAQEHNTMPLAGLKPLDPESWTLTMRLTHLPRIAGKNKIGQLILVRIINDTFTQCLTWFQRLNKTQ